MARYAPILRIKSASLRLTLEVNAESRMGLIMPGGKIEITGAPATVERETVSDGSGFGLWEQTDYRLTVEPEVADSVVQIKTRSMSLVAGIGTVGRSGALSGVLNFGSLVGVVVFELQTPTEKLAVGLEVFPSKVDYKKDYQDLLSAIDAHHDRLMFRYFQATHRLAGSDGRHDDDRDIDWLTILRAEVKRLMLGIGIIDQHPHVVLRRDVGFVRTHLIKRFGAPTITAIRQGRGKGGFIQVDVVAARERLPAEMRARTWDSPEHRWIGGQLSLIANRVRRIRAAVQAESGRTAGEEDSVKIGILNELDQLEAAINLALRIEPIRGARADPGALLRPTTVLLSKSGYAEVFRTIVSLREILTLAGVTREASISDIARLYEQWCFLELLSLVRSTFPISDPVAELRIISERLLSPAIDEGAAVLVYQAEGIRVSVTNNETVRTPTGDQRPDMIISIERDGHFPVDLILDAKYRRHQARNGSGHLGPGQDAVNAMHRYRDAITARHDSMDIRPVTHAVALFPASADESQGYRQSRLSVSIPKIGIGALPFLPGNVEYVREWLSSILADPDLAIRQAGFPTSREAETK